MPVKDSRGSGAIVEFLILALVFSSLKDRSSPRDPIVSHGEEPPGASLHRGRDESIFLLISITSQFLLARAFSLQGTIRSPRRSNPLTIEKYEKRLALCPLASKNTRDLHRIRCKTRTVHRASRIRSRFSALSSVLQITLFQSGSPFVRRNLAAEIGLRYRYHNFSVVFRMHIYISRGGMHGSAVFTGRWVHRPDSK